MTLRPSVFERKIKYYTLSFLFVEDILGASYLKKELFVG